MSERPAIEALRDHFERMSDCDANDIQKVRTLLDYIAALEAERDELQERLMEWRALGKPRYEE